jgi:hypothetical protein
VAVASSYLGGRPDGERVRGGVGIGCRTRLPAGRLHVNGLFHDGARAQCIWSSVQALREHTNWTVREIWLLPSGACNGGATVYFRKEISSPLIFSQHICISIFYEPTTSHTRHVIIFSCVKSL